MKTVQGGRKCGETGETKDFYLETGDMVPADGVILEATELKLREDMLTGEADQVTKEKEHIVYGGTLVGNGYGLMQVTKIGDATEMGVIAKDLNQEGIDEEDRAYDNVEKNKIIKLVNKDYEVRLDKIKSEANKIQSVGTPGQAAYYVAQGLSEFEKSKSQKEASIQQIQQDNQNQQENTADGLKKEIDKLADFNPFQANSSSLK